MRHVIYSLRDWSGGHSLCPDIWTVRISANGDLNPFFTITTTTTMFQVCTVNPHLNLDSNLNWYCPRLLIELFCGYVNHGLQPGTLKPRLCLNQLATWPFCHTHSVKCWCISSAVFCLLCRSCLHIPSTCWSCCWGRLSSGWGEHMRHMTVTWLLHDTHLTITSVSHNLRVLHDIVTSLCARCLTLVSQWCLSGLNPTVSEAWCLWVKFVVLQCSMRWPPPPPPHPPHTLYLWCRLMTQWTRLCWECWSLMKRYTLTFSLCVCVTVCTCVCMRISDEGMWQATYVQYVSIHVSLIRISAC